MSDSNKTRVAFQLRSSYGYSAINNTTGSKKRLLTVIGDKEEKGEKTEQSTTISSQTSSTTSGIQTDHRHKTVEAHHHLGRVVQEGVLIQAQDVARRSK